MHRRQFVLLTFAIGFVLSVGILGAYNSVERADFQMTTGIVEAARQQKTPPEIAVPTNISTVSAIVGYSVDGVLYRLVAEGPLYGRQFSIGDSTQVYYDVRAPQNSHLGPRDSNYGRQGVLLVSLVTMIGLLVLARARPASKIQL